MVDRATPVPLYFQIAQQLERAIQEGELSPGTRLESELDLARRLNVSRPTLRKAISRLADKGLVIKRHGVGTMVAPITFKRPVALTSFYSDLEAGGQHPTTKVLLYEVRSAPPAVAAIMRIEPETQLLYFERIRYARGEPISLMQNYIPARLANTVTEARLWETGFYRLLELGGVRLWLAHQTIGARAVDAREASLLDIPAGAPVLTVQRVSFDDAGETIECGEHIYRSDSYSVEVSLVSGAASSGPVVITS